MRYLVGFMCVCALGAVPLIGCSDTTGDGGSGGSAGDGGSAGMGGAGGMPECQNPEDCNDDNECTEDACSIDGQCSNTAVADNIDCDFNGLPGRCMSGVCEDAMLCEGVSCQCTECKTAVCNPNNGMCDYTFVENGTACSLGECLNGVCAGALTVGCTNNVFGDVSIVRFDLEVDPGPIAAGSPFTADLTGLARLPEWFLDWYNVFIPSGVRSVQVFDLAATVAVRSGATGADVVLGADASTLSNLCELTSTPCDPANDVNGGVDGNTDCVPVGFFNLCQQGFATIPVIDGTPNSAGGCTQPAWGTPVPDCDCTACEALDVAGCRPGDPDVPCTKSYECTRNGFCVNGDLSLVLTSAVGNYTAGPSGSNILFGWFDGLTAPVSPGLLALPPAVFANPTAPVGMRVSASGFFVAFQCFMAEDSGGPDGVATCQGGPNDGNPCQAPLNNACNDGTDAGLQCDQSSLTACTFRGTPATIGCVNSDCGVDAGNPVFCSPADLASTTPDSRLETFLVP